jgi:wyosine [tRNA(Phe)-imidazoG37] synthetase (radical SAM superfamily)
MEKNMQTVSPDQYSFCGRLRREFPSQIIADITEVCNLACIHCAHSDFQKSPLYKGSYLEVELNQKMVDEVSTSGIGITQYIRYSSTGEPLLHPHVFEMLEYAVKHSKTMVSLTTNGTLLTEAKSDKILQVGVDVIDISIDAFTPEVYAVVRRKGDLNITRANVLNLIKRSKEAGSRTKVVVSFIEQEQNRHEIQDFEQFWNEAGADYVIIRRLHSNAGFSQGQARRMHKDNLQKSRRPCLYPWERIVLNPRGWLSFCPADWTHGGSFVDYRHTTIREAWQGEFYQKLRTAHLTNDYREFEFCGQCPDWAATRWPEEGRSFADMIDDFQKTEEGRRSESSH